MDLSWARDLISIALAAILLIGAWGLFWWTANEPHDPMEGP